jgi:hypothetical protein
MSYDDATGRILLFSAVGAVAAVAAMAFILDMALGTRSDEEERRAEAAGQGLAACPVTPVRRPG